MHNNNICISTKRSDQEGKIRLKQAYRIILDDNKGGYIWGMLAELATMTVNLTTVHVSIFVKKLY